MLSEIFFANMSKSCLRGARHNSLIVYFKVYDGKSENSSMFGKYCGSNLPGVIQSSESSMKVILKTTRYFEEQVLVKRPYIKREWCHRAI